MADAVADSDMTTPRSKIETPLYFMRPLANSMPCLPICCVFAQPACDNVPMKNRVFKHGHTGPGPIPGGNVPSLDSLARVVICGQDDNGPLTTGGCLLDILSQSLTHCSSDTEVPESSGMITY